MPQIILIDQWQNQWKQLTEIVSRWENIQSKTDQRVRWNADVINRLLVSRWVMQISEVPVRFEEEPINYLDWQLSVEALVRPEWIRTDHYLDAHKERNTTAEVLSKWLDDLCSKIELDEKKGIKKERYHLNTYYWDLAQISVQNKLLDFPYKDKLVLEVLEDTTHKPHRWVWDGTIHSFAWKLKNLWVAFAVDDFDPRIIPNNDEMSWSKDSKLIYSAFRKSNHLLHRVNGPVITIVKFDGDYIRSLLEEIKATWDTSSSKKARLTKGLIRRMKANGVEKFIAEFVQSEEEIRILAKLWFNGFQGKFLKIAWVDYQNDILH